MHRRTLLSSMAACPLCAAASAAIASEGAHWGYAGESGPEAWSGLSEDYAACGGGTHQSPIDLSTPVHAGLDPVTPLWQPVSDVTVKNNGHTIQADMPDGQTTLAEGREFKLLQFHFHERSEHTVAGRHYPMEAHFVHQAAEGDLLVLGVFIDHGLENETLIPVWESMPTAEGEAVTSASFAPQALLPRGSGFYRYSGSLTTPPCSEIVSWVVYADAIGASTAQIEAFKAVFTGNFRPTQPLNRRLLLLGS